MVEKYRYGRKPDRRRRTRVIIVIVVSLLIIGIVGGLVGLDAYKHRSQPVSTVGRTLTQVEDQNVNKLSVDQPTYTMELPSDWKQIAKTDNKNEKSVTWQATKTDATNRYLKVYVDIMPVTKSINRLLPVTPMENGLNHGDISENCASFTKGGTFDTSISDTLSDTPAKYQTVDFICDLPRVTDNEVGTGSTEGINSVTVTGSMGKHKYFFLYTDRNIQPDYTILYTAIKSFKAK